MAAAITTPPRKGHRKNHRQTKSNTQESRHLFEGNDTDGDRTGSDYFREPLDSHNLPITPKATSGYHSNNGENGTRPESSASGKKRKPRQKNKPKEYPYDSGQEHSQSRNSQAIQQPTPAQSKPLPTPMTNSTTPAQAAYAGPTFHASPAPSALPMPSFFSKSVPEPVRQESLQRRLNAEPPDSTPNSPTPEKRPLPNNRPIGSESPLDLFFKADREQKARMRELEVAQSGSSSPFQQSNLARSSPFRGQSESPSGDFNRNHSRHSTGRSASGMFTLDMDGTRTPSHPYEPPFSTPFNERISAARAESAPSTVPTLDDDEEEAKRQATTKALKDLLFASPSQRPATSSARFGSPSYEPDGFFNSPSPSPQHRNHFTHPEPLPHMSQPSFRNISHQQQTRESQSRNSASFKSTPRSSGLRKEVKPSEGAGLTENEAINHGLDANEVARKFLETQFPTQKLDQRAHPRPLAETVNPTNGETISPAPDVRSMEDNLRRMLNME